MLLWSIAQIASYGGGGGGADAAERAFDQYELQLEQSTLRSASLQQNISGELNSDFIQQQQPPSSTFDSTVSDTAILSYFPL